LPLVIVDCAAYADGKRISGTLSIEEVGPYLTRPDAFVWLGLRMPNPDELRTACAVFGLGHIDVEAVLAPHRRAVLGQQAGVAWLVLRTSTYDDHEEVVHLGEISVLFSPRFLITIRHGHAAALADTRRELEHDRDRLRGGVPAAIVAVIGAVVDSYGPALDGFEKDAVEVEREVLSEARIRPIRRLLNLKRQVRELQMVVDALDDPLERLTRKGGLAWTPGTVAELQATLADVRRLSQRTRSLSDLVSDAHAANLAQVSKQQNDDMRKISAWVAIAAVPTMIAGIYGMNFEHMPELEAVAGYPVVVGVMAAACLGLYRSFRKRDWL
jgi:magnesium transporter